MTDKNTAGVDLDKPCPYCGKHDGKHDKAYPHPRQPRVTEQAVFDVLYEMRLAPRHQLEEAAKRIVAVIHQAAPEAPAAWLATDLDGRGDVAFTKEEAKRRAGEDCTKFFPLYGRAPLSAPVEELNNGVFWAMVTRAAKEWPEQREHRRRLLQEIENTLAAPAQAGDAQDAGALEIACVVNKKLGDVLAGRAYLLPADLSALKRFHECATDFDSGGHDVPKDVMARLREIGVVQTLGFGRHQTTAFGDYVLERDAGEALRLPLKTMAERNDDTRAAMSASQGKKGGAA